MFIAKIRRLQRSRSRQARKLIGGSVVEAIHALKPDLLVTSAHAMERILEMPYSDGALLAINGKVFGVPTSGSHGQLQLGDHGWELSSPNPKVWLAAGNCFVGHIQDENSIALAMMHSAGVTQMVGYTVSTWYRGRVGTLGWFQDEPGRFTMAESFFINDAAITRRLARDFPGQERHAVKTYSENNINALAADLPNAISADPQKRRELLGLVWDHDAVAFYGDPAWSAAVAPHPCDFEQRLHLDERGGIFEVEVKRDCEVKAFAFLPQRITASQFRTSGQPGRIADRRLRAGGFRPDEGRRDSAGLLGGAIRESNFPPRVHRLGDCGWPNPVTDVARCLWWG